MKRVFSSNESVYLHQFEDEKVQVISTDDLVCDERGLYDLTDALQHAIDIIKIRDRMGIVMLKEGNYYIRKTIFIPRSIRIIGFGKNRPKIILKENTKGFQQPPSDDKGNACYMFWFTSNVPKCDENIEDANPGTFYSAISNIDFCIEDNNPAAVVLRTHFAQNSFVSHCNFDIGNGKAGIFDVGNEMENLTFTGGEYGIYTTKCSPGWPFLLVNCDFYNQRKSSVYSRECGLTFSHVYFSDTPCALDTVEGYWEKAYWKDCILENISDTALKISQEHNSCTQINLSNVYCKNVKNLLLQKDTNTLTKSEYEMYLVSNLTLGDVLTMGDKDSKFTLDLKVKKVDSIPNIKKEIMCLPCQDTWVNALDFGAVGDGVCDDTIAIQKALDTAKAIYLPQGKYIVSDTLKMKDGSALIGMNPISTQIILEENSEKFAGLGSAKALLESSVGGYNLINSIGLDTASRNPRAVACKWMANEKSYVNDIKFVGGHGQVTKDYEFVPVYDKARKSDICADRPWDSQFASLWITNNGGGIFKNIWSASTYAQSGIFISETTTPGVMYQVSVEHHVRHEIVLRNVSNWKFFAIQTEEEVAEGSYCQPFVLSSCNNLIFANVYAFRVIWVDNPYPCVFKAWDCDNITMMCCHNFTQMKYTIEDWYWDMNTNQSMGFWQLSKFVVKKLKNKNILPKDINQISTIATRLDCVDSICCDSKGNYYICDSRLKQIYVWNENTQTIKLLTEMHYRPLSLICDEDDNLVVVCEYKPVAYSKVNGKDELSCDGYEERLKDCGGCYFPFFRQDRQIKVFTINSSNPEESIEQLEIVSISKTNIKKLYYPHNQWRDNGDIMSSFDVKETLCYLAKDNKTAIAHHPGLSRATGLVALIPEKDVLLVDEYGKRIIKATVSKDFSIDNPKVIAYKGEYSVACDDIGNIYIPDNLLYVFNDCNKKCSMTLDSRPANVLIGGKNNDILYITARDKVYAMKVK